MDRDARIVRVWGRYTGALLLVLATSDEPLSARELAWFAGIDASRKVFSLLRYWIERGVVRVRKLFPNLALYSVSRDLHRAILASVEMYGRMSPHELRLRLLERLAQNRLLRKLRSVERELLAILQLLVEGGSPYLRIRGSYAEALTKLKDTLRRRLEKAGLDPRTIAQELHALTELLEELTEHHIVYIHYDHKTQTLVLRLDRTLEHKLQNYRSSST